MKVYLINKWNNFTSNKFSWETSLLNFILCVCMGFFYYDSGQLLAPLLYAIFFLLYPFIVFFCGSRIIPGLYVIYSIGAIQDINFINVTVFFIFVILSWQYEKWKWPLFIIYILEAFVVCMRHDKTVIHLLFHFAYCLTFYAGALIVKAELEKRSILKVTDHFQKLDLKPEEEAIVKQRLEGKLMKEISGVSKNTKTAYIKAAMKRNGCKTQEELLALYSLQQRIFK